MKRSLALRITLLFLPTLLWSANYKTLFEEGNEAYLEKDYPKAIEQYQASLRARQTAAANFNLGNAYYETGLVGPAVLHYERALALEPNNPDAQANLNFVREQEDLRSGKMSLLERYARLLTVNTWTWLAVATFWLMISFILLPRLQGMRRPLCNGLAVLCLLAFIGSKTALYAYHLESKQGVVISQEAPLKIAPTPSSNALLYVQGGELLTLEGESFEGYLRVETLQGQSGWISNEDFSKIWEG